MSNNITRWISIIGFLIIVALSFVIFENFNTLKDYQNQISYWQDETSTYHNQAIQLESEKSGLITQINQIEASKSTLEARVQELEEELEGTIRGASGQPLKLVNNEYAHNPAWEELKYFILRDGTDRLYYTDESRVCGDFAEVLHNNAENAGIRAAVVIIFFQNSYIGHALNAFETIDRGLVYIDCTGKRPLTPSCPGRYDRIAYIQIRQSYGLISIDKANLLNYNFYLELRQRWYQYQTAMENYNNEVTRYNNEVHFKTYYIDTPEWIAIQAWDNRLEEESARLERLSKDLPDCWFEEEYPDIVKSIEVYW